MEVQRDRVGSVGSQLTHRPARRRPTDKTMPRLLLLLAVCIPWLCTTSADITESSHNGSSSSPHGRTVFTLSQHWRFSLDPHPPPPAACPLSTFPIDLSGNSTAGLSSKPGAATAEACAQECCSCGADCDNDCETWQFCGSPACGHSASKPACFIGSLTGATTTVSPDWQSFARAPGPSPPPATPPATCSAAWCAPGTDDKGGGWRSVGVPHDFVLEGTFDEKADMSHGYLPYGVGLYRKHLAPLPAEHAELLRRGTHTAVLEFDGVQANAQVYLDGKLLGTHQSGYTPFSFALDEPTVARLAAAAATAPSSAATAATPPLPLLLAVRADATRPDGWWYDGGGIYRQVRLVVLPVQHIVLLGGAYLPSTVTGTVDKATKTAPAEIAPSITLANKRKTGAPVNVNVTVTLRQQVDLTTASSPNADAERNARAGVVVGTSTATATLAPGSGGTVLKMPLLVIPKADLWSVDRPTLYSASVVVCPLGKSGGGPSSPPPSPYSTSSSASSSPPPSPSSASPPSPPSPSSPYLPLDNCDSAVVLIGVRKTTWTASSGFLLNDVPTKIKGACNHQDFAGLGVAVPDGLQVHRIQKLKDMGMNGWRTAHNAPNPALLDAADRMGFLVWDENHRNGQDDEITTLVLRDRNHPSIVLWSVCNEFLCETPSTDADFNRSVALFHALDPLGGRVVSSNYNPINGPDTPLDVQGKRGGRG